MMELRTLDTPDLHDAEDGQAFPSPLSRPKRVAPLVRLTASPCRGPLAGLRTAMAVLAVSTSFPLLAACGPRQLPPAIGADGASLIAVQDSLVLARGRHLVNGPAHCVACHTPEGPLTPLDPTDPPALVGGVRLWRARGEGAGAEHHLGS